jgi:hypothetical protein
MGQQAVVARTGLRRGERSKQAGPECGDMKHFPE